MARASKVVMCGLARNNAKTIYKAMERIGWLGDCFADWSVVIYANNCTDETCEILESLRFTHRTHTICEDIPNFVPFGPVATRKRAAHMAYCRNKYLDSVKALYRDYDYMVVTDMDLGDWKAEGVLHSLSFMDKYDAISGNGMDTYQGRPIYYDIWTLIMEGQLQNRRIKQPWDVNAAPIAVDSGFGGLAIYKIQPILDLCYGLWYDDCGVYGSEHTGLHMGLKDIGRMQAVNPYMVVQR